MNTKSTPTYTSYTVLRSLEIEIKPLPPTPAILFTNSSCVQVDPENYLGYSPHSPLEPGGDVSLGHSWAQTQAMVSIVTGPRVNSVVTRHYIM